MAKDKATPELKQYGNPINPIYVGRRVLALGHGFGQVTAIADDQEPIAVTVQLEDQIDPATGEPVVVDLPIDEVG